MCTTLINTNCFFSFSCLNYSTNEMLNSTNHVPFIFSLHLPFKKNVPFCVRFLRCFSQVIFPRPFQIRVKRFGFLYKRKGPAVFPFLPASSRLESEYRPNSVSQRMAGRTQWWSRWVLLVCVTNLIANLDRVIVFGDSYPFTDGAAQCVV